MSKDQKNIVEIPVETVYKWSKILNYIQTTLAFWKLDDKWPTNLCMDAILDISNELYELSK